MSTERNRIELYDATLRDGMGGGGLSLTAEEKLRVVQFAKGRHKVLRIGESAVDERRCIRQRRQRPRLPRRTLREEWARRCGHPGKID